NPDCIAPQTYSIAATSSNSVFDGTPHRRAFCRQLSPLTRFDAKKCNTSAASAPIRWSGAAGGWNCSRREVTAIGALFAAITLALGTASPTPPQASHENDSAAIPGPMIASRALAMLWQVVKQLENFVRDKNLAAIHNEDLILGAAANELLAEAGKSLPARSD